MLSLLPIGVKGMLLGKFLWITYSYKVYFVAEFDKGAVEFGTWKQKELKPNTTFAEGECSGVYFTFDLDKKKDIQYKIGVSYVSVDNARKNLRMENAGWNFDEIREKPKKLEPLFKQDRG